MSVSSEWGQKGVAGDMTDASVWSFSRLCAMSVQSTRSVRPLFQEQATLGENILLRSSFVKATLWVQGEFKSSHNFEAAVIAGRRTPRPTNWCITSQPRHFICESRYLEVLDSNYRAVY